ncbi:MAG: DUF397 domain-containing protein [Actinomycetota bacterium]|nr:DUF397 domain-containing protein [Actinomycetota bacterium]
MQGKEYGVVEVPPPPAAGFWQKSGVSEAAECVEILHIRQHVWVRDSKDPLGPALGFTREEWTVFLVGVQRSEFNLPGSA